jgi:peptidoglycan/xylan/chitin deacetylase (PgdA/CDA1 family)
MGLKLALLAGAMVLSGTQAQAQATKLPAPKVSRGQVALTFDDLPGLTLKADQAYVDALNRDLLRGLRRHHLPAIGFVNEGKLEEGQFGKQGRARQIANLRRWLNAGMDLGNHTFSHESPDELGGAGYIADIAKGEPVTRQLLAARGRKLQWFRFPYLETGAPLSVKRQISGWLGQHGYRIAPVTIDANDWLFAEPYDEALDQHDKARVKRLRGQYLAYTERTIAWFQQASQELFGRPIPLVMLLHATRLNADTMDDLAAILKRRGLKPVSLEQAMRDPANHTRDNYAGHDGIEWIERWSESLKRPLPWDSWQDPPKQVEQEYERNNQDRRNVK